MAFRSRLETLLKLRRSEERQQELLLLEANRIVSSLEEAIQCIEKRERSIRDQQLEELKDHLYGSQIHLDEASLVALRGHWRDLNTKLSAAVASRETRTRNFRLARRKREMVETLVSHQREEYLRQEVRNEQRNIDEVFLLRARFQSS